jgi:hypothetical protein
MRSPDVAAGSGPDAGVWAQRADAACLVLFPLLFLVFARTDLHPSPSGDTGADQVRAVGASAAAWQVVHLVLAGGSLLGMGAVLGLRSLCPRRGRVAIAASISAALGVAAAGLVAGIVLMEAALVAPVAKACAASRSCLSSGTEPFLSEFANALALALRCASRHIPLGRPPGPSTACQRPAHPGQPRPRPHPHERALAIRKASLGANHPTPPKASATSPSCYTPWATSMAPARSTSVPFRSARPVWVPTTPTR